MTSAMITTNQLNVAQLLREAIGACRAYDFQDRITVSESRPSVINGSARLMRTDAGILVEAKAHTDVIVTCSRCLSESTVPIELKFHEEYLPTIDIDSGLPVNVPFTTFAIDKNHILDLSDALQQYALLEIPIKALCTTECKGLCATCGQNLNTGTCNCSSKIDPRWSTLENLINKANKAS
ncbi:MAG: DUF177 domain-containing protein [Dehalococcoidia bacterium]|nr:DUF177 domain-containing protein [Dehalococcoidia bacterium]